MAERIIELRAENVKRLKAVRIAPDPAASTVVIAGANGAGKSSVLDSIMYALAGKRAQPDQPVRHGSRTAYVELDMGEYTVKRVWQGAHQELIVTAADGAEYTSPQQFLDKRLGTLTFDPLAFTRSKPGEQRATLAAMVNPLIVHPEPTVGGMVNLAQADALRAGYYAARTEVGRAHTQAEAEANSYPVADPQLPEGLVSLAQRAAEIEAAQAAAREYDEAEAAVQAAQIAVTSHLEAVRQALVIAEAEHDRQDHPLALSAAPVSDEAFAKPCAGLATAEATNEAIRQRDARERAIAKRDGLAHDRDRYGAFIKTLDENRARALATAVFPIPGLSFSDDGVTYNGVPLEQASQAEQLAVSIAIGMQADPEIRIMRITNGSLLDSTSMGLIEELAAEHDYQVWIEKVDETGSVGFTITDGTDEATARGEEWPAEPLRVTEPEHEERCPAVTTPLGDQGSRQCQRPPHPGNEPHDWGEAEIEQAQKQLNEEEAP